MPADDDSELLIGTGSEVITPELGCPLAGFDARQGVAERVHDDLHARAIVFDDRSVCVALVSLEVIAVSHDLAWRIRYEIERRTGISATNVIVAATHTHCGPVTLNHFFNPSQPLNEGYLAQLVERAAACVFTAFSTRRHRRIRTGFAVADGIAVNRRTANGLPVDSQAGVLLIEEPSGQPAAIMVNFACHPTVLGPDTLDITADFPFFTVERLSRACARAEVLFFNGAEGDISIGHRSDLSAIGFIAPFRTFAKAEELGCRVANAVLDAMPGLQTQRPVLAIARKTVPLPLKSYPEVRTPMSETVPQLRNLFDRIEHYYDALYRAEPHPEPKCLDVDLTAVRVGDTALLSFPGEVFVEVALAIRRRSPSATTLFLGLANDYIGYVPTRDANAAAGYEVVASRLTSEAADVLEDASVDLLKFLFEI